MQGLQRTLTRLQMPAMAMPLFALALWLLAHANYVASHPLLWLNLCAAPFILSVQKGRTGNWRFGPWALAFGALALLSSMPLWHYLFTCFVLLLITELSYGRVSWATAVYLVWLAPAFYTLGQGSSEALRLWLSQSAAQVLSLVYGPAVSAKGHFIMLSGASYHVAEACAGFEKMAFGVAFALVFVAQLGKKRRHPIALPWVLLAMAAGLGLSVAANLERIILLVMLDLGQAGPMHTAVGLLTMGILVLLPFGLLYCKIPARKPLTTTHK